MFCSFHSVDAISEEKLQSNQAYVLFYELKICNITRKWGLENVCYYERLQWLFGNLPLKQKLHCDAGWKLMSKCGHFTSLLNIIATLRYFFFFTTVIIVYWLINLMHILLDKNVCLNVNIDVLGIFVCINIVFLWLFLHVLLQLKPELLFQ